MKRVLIAGSDVILREMIFSLVADLSVEVQVAALVTEEVVLWPVALV